jgi:hypothetical protein
MNNCEEDWLTMAMKIYSPIAYIQHKPQALLMEKNASEKVTMTLNIHLKYQFHYNKYNTPTEKAKPHDREKFHSDIYCGLN